MDSILHEIILDIANRSGLFSMDEINEMREKLSQLLEAKAEATADSAENSVQADPFHGL